MAETLVDETSVLIVGGGPAGLAAAIALGQRGLDCTVVEAREPGDDKACGEGLMPGALTALRTLGVRLEPKHGHAFRGIRFANPTHRVEADFEAGNGIGVRRPELQGRLVERAADLGATLLWNSRVRLLEQAALPTFGSAGKLGRATISGKEIRFRWLIGADGQASSVRRWANLDTWRSERVRFGFRRHFQVNPWSEFVEVHWGLKGQIYVTPVAADCVCVVAMSHDSRTGWDEFLTAFPEIEQRLGGAGLGSQPRGGISAMRRLHRVANDRTALIGDASGSADSITGEGLAMTFRQATALADAIAQGSLKSYEQRHRSIGRRPHWMGGLMLTLDRWPALVGPTLRLLASTPELFSGLLNFHAEDGSRRDQAGSCDLIEVEDTSVLLAG